MSFYYTAAALRLDCETSIQKLVLITMADHADDFGDNAWPAVETIAKTCHCSERAVRAAIRSLERLGHIQTRKRHKESSVYKMMFSPVAKSKAERKKETAVRQLVPLDGQMVPPDMQMVPSERQLVPFYPAPDAPKSVQIQSRTNQEPEAPFCSPAFQACLERFESFRHELGKPITRAGRAELYEQMAYMTEAQAIQSMKESILANWVQIYPPKEPKINKPKPNQQTKRPGMTIQEAMAIQASL